MVRKLGVSHKSLLVPSVSAGTYSIRYEHADYLDRNFNITVGSGLPTTFSEAMTEKSYTLNLAGAYPAGFLMDDTVTVGVMAFAGFYITNNGNVATRGHILVTIGATTLMDEDTVSSIAIGETIGPLVVNIDTTGYTPGNYPITAVVNPLGYGITDTLSQTLILSEWATDVTFIATAPGISDLHGVEVFIDDVSMGTT